MNLREADSRRFDALFRRHHQEVFRACMRFASGDREWAQDRAQDAFVKLAQKLPDLADQDDLGGWLYRVSVNECLMQLRREKSWRGVVDRLQHTLVGSVEPTERAVQARRDAGRLQAALSELPANEQALMVLVYLDGKSQQEAADLLGFSKGYVSKLHKKALARLKEREWEVTSDA